MPIFRPTTSLIVGKAALTADGAGARHRARARRAEGDRFRADGGRSGKATWVSRRGIRLAAGLPARAGSSGCWLASRREHLRDWRGEATILPAAT